MKHSFKLSLRQLVVGLVLLSTLLTAGTAISLQYYFSRNLAIESATHRYQLTAKATADFVQNAEHRAVQLTRILAQYPTLINTTDNEVSMRDLFAEVMRSNPMLYSIYLGFPNGNFYEVVNLESEMGVRKTFAAEAEDRWVVNTVKLNEQTGTRTRKLDFYREDFTLRTTRYEPSAYDVRQRRWFYEATEDAVTKSAPYLFQYIQKPGQTYAIKLPNGGNVLGIDVTLDSFSTYLQQHAPAIEGDIYIYQQSGEMLASSRTQSDNLPLPAISALDLNADERAYLDSLGTLKVSNELDWPPIDFAVSGEPKGYAIDVMRIVAERLGLQLEFINGYTWTQLQEKFSAGEIDILQPVFDRPYSMPNTLMSNSFLSLPYGLATKKGVSRPLSMQSLRGKTLAIPSGWSIIDVLRKAEPEIVIVEAESVRAALIAVQEGKAFAALDSALILQFTRDQFFLEGIQVHGDLDYISPLISGDLHLLVSADS